MLCHYPNRLSGPNALIESTSRYWGIGAHLCNIAWNFKRAAASGFNPRVLIKIPHYNINVFDEVFSDHIVRGHSASGDHEYEVTYKVNEHVKDTQMPILTRYHTQVVNELRSFVNCLSFAKKWHNCIFKGATLGVHYRGTDKHTDYALVSPERVSDLIPMGYDNVFLATDDIDAFETITKRYPAIKYHNHIRGHSGQRGLHQCGLVGHLSESIVDLVTLCYCDHLFVPRSCFADAAIIYNKKGATWSYYA